MISSAVLVIFPMLVAFGGVSDLLTMTIQNRVSVLLVAGFCMLALAAGLPPIAWGEHLLGLLVVFVPCFLFFAAGWMGGGDVKFISAIALWIGFSPELTVFITFVAIYGMLLTLGLLFARQNMGVPAILMRAQFCEKLLHKDSGIPYGISIAVAGLQVYPETFWFKLVS
jgi:prepilin peptidase CpaA